MELLVVGLIYGVIITVYLCLCNAVAKMGERRAIGYEASWFLSFILTPIIGFLIVACIDRKFEETEDSKEVNNRN